MDEKTLNKSIKGWSVDDRPREKFLEKGRQALSHAELIAILIGSGSRSESAVELSKRILASVGNNLQSLGKLSVDELMNFKGIGEAKAITIAAALELGRRRIGEEKEEKVKINSSKPAFELFAPVLSDLHQEVFAVLGLNRAAHAMGVKVISSGGMTETLVDTRLIFKTALEMNATSLILAHNHPSGNLLPSAADINLTHKLIEAGKIMNIRILDHLIIGHNDYHSMADHGTVDFN